MYDLEISLDNSPGTLALMGRALGEAKVSVEGGGAWVVQGQGVAHFLFEDGQAAKTALEGVGITVVSCKKALVQRLKQAVISIDRRNTLIFYDEMECFDGLQATYIFYE